MGKTIKDSLGIINLTGNVTDREVKTNYHSLARIYHPDKYCLSSTYMSPNKAEEHFKLVSNTHACFKHKYVMFKSMKQKKGKQRLNSFNNLEIIIIIII